MERVIPIAEQFQHFLQEVKEGFWADLYGKTKLLWKGFWEEQSRRERDRFFGRRTTSGRAQGPRGAVSLSQVSLPPLPHRYRTRTTCRCILDWKKAPPKTKVASGQCACLPQS